MMKPARTDGIWYHNQGRSAPFDRQEINCLEISQAQPPNIYI